MSAKIVIDAAVEAGFDGGIDQYLIGLVHGLGQLVHGPEEYTVVESAHSAGWLSAYMGTNQRSASHPCSTPAPAERLKQLLGPMRRPAGVLWRRVRRGCGLRPTDVEPHLSESNGFWESLQGGLLHITYPLHFARAAVPTVLTLYDLQHRHLAEFFPPAHLQWREIVYPVAFQHSWAIVTISDFVRNDLIRQYGVPEHKIFVIPIASPMEAYEPVDSATSESIARRLRLPPSYILYPALTYEHKNHIRLLEAIALLRDRDGLRLNLVCTGRQKLHWPKIRRRLSELNLAEQVRFVGFVSIAELRAIFARAQYLVFPSLFEGAGIPLLEAFGEGLPVTCSDIPAFREYGGSAPLYFNPTSVEEIAAALKRMNADRELRDELRERGNCRKRLFSWMKSAESYRAVYRLTMGNDLSDRDRALLGAARKVSLGETAASGKRSI
jgi:glycosyltransferase involved in cell wall biosynthesis